MQEKFIEPEPVYIGVPATEPIRVAGLASIFDQPARQGQARLVPIVASLSELLNKPNVEYLVVDLHSFTGGAEVLETVRQARPEMRQIVIGPEGDDELVMDAITAGARAYLGYSAGPDVVRKAIEVVTAGSIWAPRHLLSRLIDRLLNTPRATVGPRLTPRERQVLELILTARSTREIASELGIEQRTVKAYVARLMRKTGVDNRVKLSVSALSRSLLTQETGNRGDAAEGGGAVTDE